MKSIPCPARILCLLAAGLLLAAPIDSGAQPLPGWSHVYPLTVTNAGPALADHQVRVALDAAGFDFAAARPDGGDLRVTLDDGVTLLPHWLETWDPVGGLAVLWVRVDVLQTAGSRTLLLHAGNPSAASVSDGAATFLFFSGFEELAGLSAMNAPAPLVTPTYEGSGQLVHPDVVHVPGGWNGYEYWMGMTPYPASNDSYENPSVIASNDNITWVEPAGISNPLAPTPPGHNDDVDMLLVDGVMVLYYVETNDNSLSSIMRLASTDGADWGAPQAVLVIPNYVMSPAVVHEDGVWTMWYLHSPVGCASTYQDVVRRTSADGVVWGPEEVVTLAQPGRVPWHFDIQPSAGGYVMLFISYPDGSTCGTTQLYHATSDDGLVWTATPEPVLTPAAGSWDSANIYRASFTLADDNLRIWYSARSTVNQWRVGYTEGTLDDFLGAPLDTWSALHGDAAAGTEHVRSGTHGLQLVGGSTYPQVFGALDGGGVCVSAWYHDDLAVDAQFMAVLRLWDSDTAVSTHHCIGLGVWTGASTTHYSHHGELFAYAPTAVARDEGWRHLSIAAVGDTCRLRIDGLTVATESVLDPALMDRFSLEGYRGGTGWFDDAYVRRYAEPEPSVSVGGAVVSAAGPVGPALALAQNVPNPLNPVTRISFTLEAPGRVRLRVFDLRGHLVRTLLDGASGAGTRSVTWDGRDGRGRAAATGVYLYRLEAGGQVRERKMTLLR